MSESATVVLQRLGADVAAVQREMPGIDLRSIRVRPAPRWLIGRPFVGIALPWGVHLRPGLPDRQLLPTLLHELVHMDQWQRSGVVRFSLRYLTDYLRGRLARRSHRIAYLEIEAEDDARRRTVHLLHAARGGASSP